VSADDGLAEVVTLPTRGDGLRAGLGAAVGGVRAALERVPGEVDDWGRDPACVARLRLLAAARWNVVVSGAEHLPRQAGALIVVNARRFSLAPIYTALALGDAITRPVRFVGRPDIAPFGPLLQRLGGLLTRTDELTGALRHGQVVVLGTGHTAHPRHVGPVDHVLVGAAVAAKVKVFPAATASAPLGRGARVHVGPGLVPNLRRRGPLAELELADDLRVRIQSMLDEFGGTSTGTPLDWLPLSGMGGG
jgi:hypothetical protein